MQLSTPVHSKTASKPSSSPSTLCTASLCCRPAHPDLATSMASKPDTRGPLGRAYVPLAQPIWAAKSSLACSMSTATTDVKPLARAREHARRPTAPAPRISTREPGCRCARRKAWRTTERGSARAATSRVTVSGSLTSVGGPEQAMLASRAVVRLDCSTARRLDGSRRNGAAEGRGGRR